MGKSPGKWIKAKLFGKKSTKSVISKKGEAGKEAFIISKASSGDVTASDPVISNPIPIVIERNVRSFASKNQTDAISREESSTLLSVSQDGAVIAAGLTSVDNSEIMKQEQAAGLTSVDNSEIMKQEQAAAKVQAATRGFLARRAFKALKGIIRLQALIRGHLVRRQAVATLHCVQGIIRFQALFRGQKARLSEPGTEVKEKCNFEKLQLITIGTLQSSRTVRLCKNLYAQKLFVSLPKAIPLSLQYDPDDANSAWNWLDRWSTSHFWELVVEIKKDKGSKLTKKVGANKEIELENGRPKRGNRRNFSANHETSFDNGKQKNTMKKSRSHQGEPTQENGPNELEKVKRNLRKVSLTKSVSNDEPEAVIEKPKSKVSKMLEVVNPIVREQVVSNSVEKHNDKTDSSLNEKQNEPSETIPTENVSKTFGSTTEEPVIVISSQHVVEEIVIAAVDEPYAEALDKSIKNEKTPPVVNQLLTKEDSNGKDNQKAKRRRSLSTKHEYPDNVSQNTPALPSYMQATESAKAKLRAQGSPRLSQDTTENSTVRRHSLPSSIGGKLNTPSPRIQKLVQGSGKGGFKSDKSLSASKDYNR